MRELYLFACGVVLGLVAADWLESRERRIAYRAADIAEENFQFRRRCSETPIGETTETTPAPAKT